MSQAFDHCDDFVKRFSYERYLSTLYAPAIARPSLSAIYAFACEIARIRELVNEPMPGEIRLQWWHDTLSGTEHGDVEFNPVAQAVLQTIDHHKLPKEPFLNLISARRFDLYSDPMPTLNDLEGYCGETNSSVVLLASLILGGEHADTQVTDACGHGGVAYALAGLLQTLTWQAARHQQFIPNDVLERHSVLANAFTGSNSNDGVWAVFEEMITHCNHHLDQCEAALVGVDPRVLPAFLPVFQARLFLNDADKDNFEPLVVHGGASHMRRMWCMWRTSRHLAKLV
ncbi:phytoene/squalene synthase family protein [Pseudovibrio sp. Tun.PSC04-5.I4]|uniref:phytoene/squalene synthase family protein n=1 Tax=Pseudovibrio sp. Tun.PSC04-5.I4 TaxID=1798213 RepID=UPI0008832991|nr:phytoene/squalene synthase family protein [Pseudovibrio sp. Tun.PSC04-5.I4]SDR04381.1 phytoene synthase [Pseudovibrio sp. Tun.PSC04-5.I4]